MIERLVLGAGVEAAIHVVYVSVAVVTALLLGLWIPNFYYWGLNQYITQRTLGSESLAEGQRGIVFAAGMKLLLPLGIVIPGMIAFNLYADGMAADAGPDNASVLVQYVKANPETGFVEVDETPTDAEVAAWDGARYLLAVYPNESAIPQAARLRSLRRAGVYRQTHIGGLAFWLGALFDRV
mgnify:CR=1 FL=1